MPHVLVIEDDPRVRGALAHSLGERGHAVTTAVTGMDGLDAAIRGRPDLVVLDLGLPDVDGVDVLRMLRAVSRVPVIVATARDDERQIVSALDAGGDDYLVKPFGAAQLDARIRAVLRRAEQADEQHPTRIGGLWLHPGARETTLDGRPVELAPKEFDLLAYLVERAGQVVSRRELLAEIWQLPYSSGDNTLDVHLSWLRRKLGESAQAPVYLHTVRGVGIKLVDPAAGRA